MKYKEKLQNKIKFLGMPILNKKGMEFVQVGILISIAIVLGVIFKTEITEFVKDTFANLNV